MATHIEMDIGTTLDERVIQVRRLVVGDETAVRVATRAVESGAPPEDAVTRMIEVGARVLDGAEAVASADVVRVALDGAASRAAAEFAGGAEGAVRALDRAISRYLDPDSGELARQLSEESGGYAPRSPEPSVMSTQARFSTRSRLGFAPRSRRRRTAFSIAWRALTPPTR